MGSFVYSIIFSLGFVDRCFRGARAPCRAGVHLLGFSIGRGNHSVGLERLGSAVRIFPVRR